MVRVRVDGKIQELSDSQNSSSGSASGNATSTEYETDSEPEKRKKEKKFKRKKHQQRKRKNARSRSQDSKSDTGKKRQRRDRRCRSHEGRLPEEEVRHSVSKRSATPPSSPTKKQKPEDTSKPKKKSKERRSRSRTRSSSHSYESCVDSRCRYCRKHRRRSDAELYPEVSVFNLQLIGNLPAVIEFIYAKKKWLIVHLTDLALKENAAIPVDFWMNDDVIEAIQGAAYVIQISLDTLDGQSVVHKYRCLSRECIIIVDPVILEKRAFWQSFRNIDEIYPDLLIFLDSQTFFLLDGQKCYFPGKKGNQWPRLIEPYLLPGPSKEFDKNKRMTKSPSKSPSLHSGDSTTALEPQSEPLNLSRKMSTTTLTASSTGEEEENNEEEDYASDESPSSQTANASGSPTLSSVGNPPTPSDEQPEQYDPERPEIIDPNKLMEQTRAAIKSIDKPEELQSDVAKITEITDDQPTSEDRQLVTVKSDSLPEAMVPEDIEQIVVPDELELTGEEVNLMEEINMQRAIMQSLGLQGTPDPPPTSRPPSPTQVAAKPFRVPPATINPLEPIVELSTLDSGLANPFMQAVYGPPSKSAQGPPRQLPPAPKPVPPPPGQQTMALVPVKNPEGNTSMQLIPCQVVRPSIGNIRTQVPTGTTLLPFADNPVPAHTGDGVYAGGFAQPYTFKKQFLTICFVMPWGARHYIRELHTDNTMKDLLQFLQDYLRRYKDIDWYRDIVDLKMSNPKRNLSKLPVKTKLRDAKFGSFPVIFILHQQFLDRMGMPS